MYTIMKGMPNSRLKGYLFATIPTNAKTGNYSIFVSIISPEMQCSFRDHF